MNLQFPFYKFAFRFDTERLLAEVGAIPETAWRFHHENFKGNSALHLISTNGTVNDEFEPPMRPTEYLERCPYIMQIMAQFKTLLGRARLMRLEPGYGVPAHFDLQHYWRTHTRVHIPVLTHPDIIFHSGDQAVHMASGEAWTFDNWRVHKVVNETQVRRIHLTFDTYGSTAFWQMAKPLGREEAPQLVPYREGETPRLMLESFVDNPVMTPGDVELEFSRLVSDAAAVPGNDPAGMARLMSFAGWLRNEWRALWYAVGPTPEGTPQFVRLMQQAMEAAQSIPATIVMASNGRPLMQALPSTIATLVKPQAYAAVPSKAPGAPVVPFAPKFDRPVFIVSAPRSGSTWLYDMLARNEAFWTLGGEGHFHVEQIAALDPRRRGYDSNRLTAEDATAEAGAQLRANYLKDMRDVRGVGPNRTDPLSAAFRFLEKTPKNALRIPFLKALFPDARFIFLHREAQANVSGIMEAWRSGNFVTYPALPGWTGLPWSMLLIPGWRELIGASLEQIAMRQWRDANEIILDDLSALPPADWCVVRYEDLQHDLEASLKRLCAFADVPFGDGMQKAIQESRKPSRYTLSQPDPQKWRKNEPAVTSVMNDARGTAERLSGLSGIRDA